MVALNNAPGAQTEITKAGPHPLISATFITVRRDNEDYFDASVTSFLEGLSPRERRALHLNIFFADTNATRHPSWGLRWVDRLADQVSTYNNLSSDQLSHLQELTETNEFQEKGIL